MLFEKLLWKKLTLSICKYFWKSLSEDDNLKDLEFDSLIGLDITTFNDEYFPDLKIDYENIKKSKTIKDLIKLYGNKIN